MVRARRYTLALAACFLALFGAGQLGLLSVHAASEYALQFDGVDDRVTFGQALGLGAQNFTLELWFKKTGNGIATSTGTGGVTAVPLVTKGMAEAEGSNVDMNYFLGIDSATKVLAADFEDKFNGGNHPVLGKTIICDNIWYHAAVTYDSTTGTWRLYLNGDLENTLVVATPTDPNQRVPRFDSIQHAALGTALNSTGGVGSQTQGFFKGQMDEVRIWNVARSQADVRSTMGGPLLIPPSGLIGRWGLDDGSGLVALNSAGAINGSLLPAATPPVFVLGGSGYAPTTIVGNQGLRFAPTSATVGDYVTFGAATATLGTPTFTVEARFKKEGAGFTTSTGTGGVTAIPLVTKGGAEGENSNVDMNYFLGISSAGVIAADFEEGVTANPGLNHPISGTTPIVNNVWYTASVTYDGTTLRLYLNGVLEGAPIVVGRAPRSDSIQHAGLGTSLNSTGARSGFFQGTLDEARIWNYARTPEQILAGVNREIATAPGLLGRWGFNECCGRVTDTSGHIPLTTAVVPSITVASNWVTTPTLTGVANAAPAVDAGFDSFVSTLTAPLTGSVIDDGVDTGTPLTTTWSKTSGPGTVSFANANAPITTATFSLQGTYVLTLTANDGELSTSDSVTVQVTAVGSNLPPTANAGPDQVVTFPSPVLLTGSYTDDGLPGVDVDTTWSVVSGPGTVTIAEPFELNTSATFSATGTYVLKLTADDSLLTGSDTITITVSAVSTNYGIDLNGTSAAVTLGVAPGLGASVFTLEAWIKREGAGVATSTGTGGVTAIPIVTKGMAQADGSNLDMNYFLGIDSATGKLVADFEDMATGGNHPIAGQTVISSNIWHHVAATYDGTKWVLYLDGISEGQLVVSQTPRADSIQHAAIGTALGSGGVVGSGTQGFFNGVIDEVRIWNVARSLSDIQSGMSGEVASSPNLLGRWGLNEGAGAAGTVIADGSGHGITGTAVGTFTWVPGAPFTAPNHAPGAPVLVAPAIAAANVTSPATLNVSVSDSDNDLMTVTYFGRKKTATAPDFTYVTIPDTQHYVDNTNFPGTFTAQTSWIVANRTPMNIAFVSQLGDLTEHLDAQPIEWTRADTSMRVLDVAGIPYGTAPGNHDQSATGVAAMFDLTFPPSRYLGQPWYLGYMGANAGEMNRLNKDNYEEFTVGSLKFLVIHIELDWPAYAVTWADQVIKAHPNHRVILSSHAFLDTTNTRPTVAQFRTSGPVAEQGMSAEAVWQQLVKPNCNVFMVVNGHYPGEGKRTDLNSCGQPVHQILMDYQSRANGGDGWLRYFRFQPSQNKISALTYSVTRNEFETDADSQFDLSYDMQGTPFTVIGTQTNVPTGSSSVPWTGLDAGADYEWYATVNDGKQTTTGPLWNFTAMSASVAPVASNDSYTVNEDASLTVPAPGVLGNDTDANSDPLTVSVGTSPQHGALTLNANGSFTYTPDHDYQGQDSFTYTANDGALSSNVATVSITVASVNDAPVALNDAFFVNEDQTLSIAAPGVLANDSDADAGTLHAVLAGSPAHGTAVLNVDGSFTYTPAPNFNGVDVFTYKANDGTADSNVATVSITVESVNDAPVAMNDSYSATEDTPLSVAAPGVLGNDTDGDSNPLTAILASGPTHGAVTLNVDGSFTYTPALNFNGSDSFTYKANDGTSDSGIATVAITVGAVNDAPLAVNDSYSATEDTLLSVAGPGVLGNDTDVDGNSLSAILASGPAHGAVTLSADGSFTYMPNANFNGADAFTYKANDGTTDSNVATVSITVGATNDAPVAVNDSYTGTEDTPLTIAAPGILANDSDADGDALAAIVVSQPAHGAVTLNADGSFTYMPALNFNGSDSFTYKANDGTTDSNIATVAISVTATNDAPVAVNDSYTGTEDTALTIPAPGVVGNDTDADGDALTAIVVSQPAHGALTLNADGSFSYMPALNFNGSDAFTYKANDGTADSNVATVSISVTATNDAPVAANDSYTGTEDTPLTIAAPGILGNDSDADGDTLTTLLVSGPSHGTLTLNAGGFTYTPAANFDGSDSFTYKANDGTSDSNIATVVIAIAGTNDAPVAANDSYTGTEDTALTIAAPGVLGNDSDVDGDSLTAILVSGPAHGTLTLTAGGFTYTPAVNFNGSDSFTYKANDGTADSNIATVAISVTATNDAPVAANDSYTGTEDTALTIAAPGVVGNDTDADGDALTALLVSGPSHGTLALSASGGFTYTPAANFNGSDSFTYKANDGTADSNVATVSLSVTATNDAPVAANDSYAGTEDTALTIAAPGVVGNDTDADGDALTALLVNGPSHGTLALSAGGGFTYTPAANFNGSDSFTYKANDGTADSNVATVAITIAGTNDAPVAVNDSYSGTEDTPLTIAAPGVVGNDTDADGDALTALLVSGPSHGSLALNANGGFTYTPAANFNGSDSFTYKANDGAADSNVATVSISVAAANDAPVAVNDSYTGAEDTPLTIAAPGVVGNDSDADGDALTALVVSGPSHGTLALNANGGFTYTPAANFNGSDSFTYKANDGTADSNVATVALSVSASNDAPLAVNDSYAGTEDTPLTIAAPGVVGNDTDADGDALTALLVTGPSHGTLALSAGGGFTYTPAANFNGSDAFTYKVNDGTADSNVATVSISVAATNDAPLAANDSYAGTEDTPLTITAPGVVGNDSDADGDALTAVLVTQPAHGAVTLNANGSFTYTPALNFSGNDAFTYKANDGTTDSNVATVAITIAGTNDAPVAANDSYSGTEDTPLTIAAPGVVGNDTDADGDTLTAILVGGPAHGTVTVNANGGFTYTPAANYNGSDSFTYKANDGTADSNVATVAITIAGTNDAPVATDDSYSGTEDTLLTIAAPGVVGNDSDADGNALTALLVSGPAHGTLTLNAGGSFTYMPAANFNGSDSFTYKANDGTVDSNVATVAISVGAANDAPVAVNDSFSATEDTLLTIAAPGVVGNDTDADGDALKSVLVTGPAHGTLTLNVNGGFTYMPALNYNGSDSFTYRANDGAADSNVATVAITVGAVNDAPVAANDSYSATGTTALTVPSPGVLANDADVDSSSLQASLVSGPSHGTLTLNTNGSFTFTAASGFSGSDSFTYKVSDGTASSNTATVTISVSGVNEAPVAQDQAVQAETAKPASIVLAATDREGHALTYRIVRLPQHGTLTGAPPNLQYTSAKKYLGSDSLTFVANDGTSDSNVATVSITVVKDINDPPVAYNQAVQTREDEFVRIKLTADDPDKGASLTFNVVTGPAHGTLAVDGKNVKYTPNPDYNGPDSFTFQASDSTLLSNLATVSITVTSVNDPPAAQDQSVVTNSDQPVAIVLAATDVEGSALTYRIVNQPRHGTLSGTGATRTYTPASHYFGPDSFTFVANDGTDDSDVATVSITVKKVNHAPVAQNQSVQTDEDDSVWITLVADDADGDSLDFDTVGQPAHGTVFGPGRIVRYKPDPNYNGPDSFTFRASDKTLTSNIATVSITVRPVNDPPVAQDQSVVTNSDQPVAIVLAATDLEGNPLTYRIVNQPRHGTMSGTGATRTYTPANRYFGPDSFTFVANDGTDDSDVATVSITVKKVNHAPVAQNQSVQTDEDDSIWITLAADDSDGDSLDFDTVGQPAHGTVFGPGRIVRYKPDPNYHGPDSFRFRASDRTLDSNIATVNITVASVNDAPDANRVTVSTSRGNPVSGLLSATDVDGDTIRYRMVVAPRKGTVTINQVTGAFTYRPDSSSRRGQDFFKYVANDGRVDSDPARVVINLDGRYEWNDSDDYDGY